jgi:hypothetical protein
MLRAACSAPSTFIAELERSAELSESLFVYCKWRTKVGDLIFGIIGMPILGPRTKFGTPFGLRGSESRGCVRRPNQNRSGSRGIGFGIRNRELMIQICEFGIKHR